MPPLKPDSKPHTILRPFGLRLSGTARARDNLMLLKILAIALAPLGGIATTQAIYCHLSSPTLTINQCIAREMTQSDSAKAPAHPKAQPAQQRSAHPSQRGEKRGSR